MYLFPTQERLKNKTLFKKVFEQGRKYRNKFIIISVLANKKEQRRAGFSVSNKIKSVCLKHKIKRRLKEIYRLNLNKIKKGFDIIVIGKQGMERLEFKETENILLVLFKQANLMLCLFVFVFLSFTGKCLFSDTITIGGVGDIYLGGNAEGLIKKYGEDYPFKNVKPILSECNIIVGNLESSFTTSKKQYSKKTHYLKVAPSIIECLKASGIDVVCLSNNHIMDYGKQGLQNTMKLLQDNNIGYTGAGTNIKESREPYFKEVNGIKCAFLSFGAIFPEEFYATNKRAGIASVSEPVLKESISNAKKNADLVIVSFHWGKELVSKLDYYQVKLAHTAIENGASLVLGHHPHIIQPIEYYMEGVICYSLGNFVFGTYSDKVKNSIILKASFEKKDNKINISKICVVPICVDNKKVSFQPTILNGNNANMVLNELKELTKTRGTNLRIDADIGIIEPMEEMDRLLAVRKGYLKEPKNKQQINTSGGTIIVPSSRGKFHIVKKGETLSKIAKKYRVKVSYIKKLNKISSSIIRPKQVLTIKPAQKIAIKSAPLPSTDITNEEMDETTMTVIESAMEYLGLKYKFGGEGKGAIDCSALIQKAFKSNNITLPRTAKGQFEVGNVVKELKPGDLLFFATRAPYASHVGMYLGNNEFIHASRENGVCVTSIYHPYYASHFIGAKRIINVNKDNG